MKFTCYRKEKTEDGIIRNVENRVIDVDTFKISTSVLLKTIKLFNITKLKDNWDLYWNCIVELMQEEDKMEIDKMQPLIMFILDLLDTNPDEIYELCIELFANYGGISYEEAKNADVGELVPLIIECFTRSFGLVKGIKDNSKKK